MGDEFEWEMRTHRSGERVRALPKEGLGRAGKMKGEKIKGDPGGQGGGPWGAEELWRVLNSTRNRCRRQGGASESQRGGGGWWVGRERGIFRSFPSSNWTLSPLRRSPFGAANSVLELRDIASCRPASGL